MSSPSNHKSTEPETSSSPAKTPPSQDLLDHTRRAPGDFGARLANARILRPAEAPPPPAPCATSTAAIVDGGPSLILTFAASFDTATSFKPISKYGGVPGSYRSPYDGGGRTPGDQHLPASSTTVEEFEARDGTDARRRRAATAAEDAASEGSAESDQTVSLAQPGRTISFGMMPPMAIRDKGKAPTAPQVVKKVAPTVAEGVSTLHYTCS
jgi:hypothetical protein